MSHDSVTNLPSRQTLLADIAERTRASDDLRSHTPFALVLLHFDVIDSASDALGRIVADRLLVEVGQRLTSTVRRDDMVARLGRGQFAIRATGVPDQTAAHALAAHIIAALAEPAHVNGVSLDVTASVGIALYPDHGQDAATLLGHAQEVLTQARLDRAASPVSTHPADATSAEALSLLADLRLALEEPARRGEISFHYQPQIAIETGELVGVETLLRWSHPRRGAVSAADAVHVAERSTAIHLLTVRALDEVIGQLASWNAQGQHLRAAINASVRDLHTSTLADYLALALRRSGINPNQIEVEVTETALMIDPQPVLATAKQLAELGVRLTLDDFGTGYSSLQHLRQLPLSKVKIDRSFVHGMTENADDEAIVRGVTGLAHGLGLQVVAEGVDNDTTHRMLLNAGCDVGQGWYYAPAMPADQLVAWLLSRSLHRAD